MLQMTLELAPTISIGKAYSPSHITGFYSEMKDESVLKHGSMGAGISITKGVTTKVELFPHDKNNFKININGVISKDAMVSKFVINEFLKRSRKKYFVKVNHQIDMPIGYGLGTSGSAALSLSYALNHALSLGLSDIEAAQIAHSAEIHCKTGLGTVLSEYYGGLCIRLKGGAPGIGKTSLLKINNSKAVIFCFSPIFTRYFIESIGRISNNKCTKMMMKILKTKDIVDFLDLSYDFSQSLKFVDKSCNNLMELLAQNGFHCSVALFGQTVFTIVKENELEAIRKISKKFPARLYISDIENEGARLITEHDT
jgi:pantoate kinase